MPGLPRPLYIDGIRFPDIKAAARSLAANPAELIRVDHRLRYILQKGHTTYEGHRVELAQEERKSLICVASTNDSGELVEAAPFRRFKINREPGDPLIRFPHFAWGVTPPSFFA
jgi:hypothetical protein